MEQVVLVDDKDNEIGLKEKVAAHLGQGDLHRAFAALVINKKGETLIAKRSASKMLWPLYWDNACASHPRKGESQVKAAERRTKEELGFTSTFKEVDKFQYQSDFKDVGAENEVCATLIGEYDGPVNPNPAEVVEYKWISIADLKKDLIENENKYTPWLKIAFERLIEKGEI